GRLRRGLRARRRKESGAWASWSARGRLGRGKEACTFELGRGMQVEVGASGGNLDRDFELVGEQLAELGTVGLDRASGGLGKAARGAEIAAGFGPVRNQQEESHPGLLHRIPSGVAAGATGVI